MHRQEGQEAVMTARKTNSPARNSTAGNSTPPNEVRDFQLERYLDEKGFEWKLENRKLGDIDEKQSKAQQNREGRFYTDDVTRYVAARHNGDTFPAMLCHYDSALGKLVIDDGIHRYESGKQFYTKLKDTSEWMYVVYPREDDADDPEVEQELIENLRRWVNTKNGVPLEKDQQERAALRLIALGWDVKAAAREVRLLPGELEKVRKEYNANARLRANGVNPDLIEAKVTRQEIAKLDDELIPFAANLAMRYNLGTDDMTELSKRVRSTRSQTERMRILSDAATEIDNEMRAAKRTGRPVPKRGNLTKKRERREQDAVGLLNAAVAMLGQIDAATLALLLDTPEKIAAANDKVDAGAAKFREIRKVLDQ